MKINTSFKLKVAIFAFLVSKLIVTILDAYAHTVQICTLDLRVACHQVDS